MSIFLLPGHCAQYCTYTTMENDSKDIVHVVTIDKRETQRNSVIMEKEAFIQTVDQLSKELKLKEVVTDAHRQISALMGKQCLPFVIHYAIKLFKPGVSKLSP